MRLSTIAVESEAMSLTFLMLLLTALLSMAASSCMQAATSHHALDREPVAQLHDEKASRKCDIWNVSCAALLIRLHCL